MGFRKLDLNEKLLKALELMHFSEPTPIQASCIPKVLAGKDIIGQSFTGSGKTAAFGLPILGKIVPGGGIQLLVLTPTRELAVQVRDHLDQMAKFLPINIYSIYGGTGFFQQYEDIKNAEAVVATPGRLLDHLRRGTIKLGDVKFAVLDEADKMLEMGFEEDVEEIIRHTPKERQTVFFSATMPPAALRLIHKYMKNPELIKEKLRVDRDLLKQVYYDIPNEDKFSLLVKLLGDNAGGSAIVFCGTKRAVDKIARGLRGNKIKVMPVHGDLNQARRLQAVNFLKSGKIDVLVATDVAARGLDIKDITHIFNYDVPRTSEEYVHRIGRTARAGKKGDAVTLLSERDYKNFENVLSDGSLDIREAPVPEFEKIRMEREHYGGHGNYSHGRRDYGGGRGSGGGRNYGNRKSYGERGNHGEHRAYNRTPHGRSRPFGTSYGSAPQRARGDSSSSPARHHVGSYRPHHKKFHGHGRGRRDF